MIVVRKSHQPGTEIVPFVFVCFVYFVVNKTVVITGPHPELLTSNIVNFFTKSSDQRERAKRFRAVARLGWRMCRPVNLAVNDEANTEIFPPAIVMHTPSIHPPMAVIAF